MRHGVAQIAGVLAFLGGVAVLAAACATERGAAGVDISRESSGAAIAFHPIGTIRSPYAARGRAPRQGALAPDVESRIVMDAAYVEALQDLESFSHLIVLYAFDRGRPWSTLVKTPWHAEPRGLFATRSPDRPNPIGFTVVRLLRREGGTLHVGGLDALDGTPVLDLKPYVPRFDCVTSASAGWLGDSSLPPANRMRTGE